MGILEQATCVGVIPGMKKGGLIWGAQYGQGVVTCRTGHGWSAPVFIRMEGGSFGFQAGGQSTDLVLVAVNDRGFQDLLKNKFKIGGDASAAAGPVGRDTQASTDWKMSAELLSYSRSKGLFAGISLDGTSVSQNAEDTDLYLGQSRGFEGILKGEVPVPRARCRLSPPWRIISSKPSTADNRNAASDEGWSGNGLPLACFAVSSPRREATLEFCL